MLLTNKPTNKQTNPAKNITFLVEVKMAKVCELDSLRLILCSHYHKKYMIKQTLLALTKDKVQPLRTLASYTTLLTTMS